MGKQHIYFNGSYLTKAQQGSILWEGYIIHNTFHIGEKKPQKWFLYWWRYLVKNIWINFMSKERKVSNIQVFNSIIWCFFYDSSKKNILIVHSYDIGIGSHIVASNSHSYIKKIGLCVLEKILWSYIRRKILLFDRVFVATQDRLKYIQKNISSEAEFLPNIIEWVYPNKKQSDSIQKVLCPERVDSAKWLEYRKKVIQTITQLLPKVEIELLERGENIWEFKKWLNSENIKVRWIEYMTPTELHGKIRKSDLVIGIFQNGALSMTNMETMLLQTAIVTYDTWWPIQVALDKIEEYTEKLLQDEVFRRASILKNYNYITAHHSVTNYREIFMNAL